MPCQQKSGDINMRNIFYSPLQKKSAIEQSNNDSKKSFSKLQHSINNLEKLRTMGRPTFLSKKRGCLIVAANHVFGLNTTIMDMMENHINNNEIQYANFKAG